VIIPKNIGHFSNSLFPDKTPSYSASYPDPSCFEKYDLGILDIIGWVKL